MSTVHLSGTIQRVTLGMGAWTLVTDQGDTYELHRPPADLCNAGLAVTVQGQIRSDIATLAMVGPVLEIKTFSIVE
ncbi:MAG: hypothetical protein IGR80_15830 [Synechococcales cyanobacterium K44_A2020_017]|uniref:hypothetical protein n=1 Tax=Leptolyngbya sp. CCY15150 TaxID=2767772 RepID=UPI00194EFB6A|nr:hypothetical protein [Leptolyngbya sp. CCY15150]MBF2087587.1 hypothetical protein [Synechococcales cyanobacterium K32_A2020_035]MBF2096208.1 hypothetical protein [Synechococcales cyanobacterium K44_A2020_017]